MVSACGYRSLLGWVGILCFSIFLGVGLLAPNTLDSIPFFLTTLGKLTFLSLPLVAVVLTTLAGFWHSKRWLIVAGLLACCLLYCFARLLQPSICPPFAPLTAQQFHKRLSAAEKAHILDSSHTEVTNTDVMPASVRQAFAEITGEPSFALANPGQKYQATDFVDVRELPRRRLVFAGVRGDDWFVHYEVGGIGHFYCVLLLKVDPQNRRQFVWGGVGTHGARNLDQLRRMVAAGDFSDEMQNYW
jgi:hypothetical protein